MIDLLDYGFAWVAVFLAIILSVIVITRKIAQSRSNKKDNSVSKLNRFLRKPHKTIGILLIVVGLVHGLASSQTVWSLNVGTICWILSILLGVNWLIRSKLKPVGGWLFYHRFITVLFLASIVWHVVDVGGIRVFDVLSAKDNIEISTEKVNIAGVQESVSQPSSSESGQSENASKADNTPANSSNEKTTGNKQEESTTSASVPDVLFDGVKLKDGVYTGSANAYGPDLTVKVTVKKGKVASVEVVSHNERNSRFYAAPIEQIPQEIIDQQTLNVDTVSGATFTSTGIINAVIDALSGAVTEGKLPEPLPLPQGRRH